MQASNVSSPVILVLDSGIGGLSVCRSILSLSPEVRQVYVADDAYFPYGTMTEETLIARLVGLCEQLIPLYQPALVVLACNTVSTLLLPELRSRFSVPFVGVVPAIKPAAELSLTRHIGLLATPATIIRPYTDELVNSFAADCRVTRVGTRELVEEAEKLFRGEPVSQRKIQEVIAPLARHPDLDTVVLGCTHFPFLKSYLSECLPGKQWVDSGQAIARRVQYLLHEKGFKQASQDTVIAAGNEHLSSGHGATDHVLHRLCFSGTLPGHTAFETYLQELGFFNSEMHLL